MKTPSNRGEKAIRLTVFMAMAAVIAAAQSTVVFAGNERGVNPPGLRAGKGKEPGTSSDPEGETKSSPKWKTRHPEHMEKRVVKLNERRAKMVESGASEEKLAEVDQRIARMKGKIAEHTLPPEGERGS